MNLTLLLPIILWLVLAAACGWRAKAKGYSYGAAFAAALLLSPLTVAIILAFLPFRNGAGYEPTKGAPPKSLDDKGLEAIAEVYAAKTVRDAAVAPK